jgi:glycosyltransferase involved in cell wall biosynthesis
MNVVHCLRAPVGGVFRHVRDLAESQARAGHAVGLVCDASTGGAFAEAALASIAPYLAHGVLRVPMRRLPGPGDIAATVRLVRHLKRIGPDVLHGHGAKGGAYARLAGTVLRAAGQPVARVYSPHGGSLHTPARSLQGRLFFPVERALERATEMLVFVSGFERTVYAEKVGVPTCPSALVYNGLAAREFEPLAPEPDAAAFVSVGEMRRLKGTDVLIEAVALLAERGRDASLVLVGPGDPAEFRALAEACGVAGRVAFRPPMPVREALALGRIAVVPSRAESLPYVALETIAAGRPLVATRVGGIPEIVGRFADALVEPGDPVRLADAMAAALDEPAAALARADALRADIRPLFSIDAMAGAIDGLYRRIAAARARPSLPAVAPNHDQTQGSVR